jgi:2-aminoethylphosphonate transport system substrate-binding protein
LADVAIMLAPDIAGAAGAGLVDAAPGAGAVPPGRCGAGRTWCAIAEDYTSWVFNPDTVGTPPATWDDLLAPRFHAAVLTTEPTNPIGLAQVIAVQARVGTDGAIAFLAALEPSVVNHYTLSDTMSRVVAAGGALVASGDLQEDLNDVAQYHAVRVWFPDATTVEIPYGAGLVTHAAHPLAGTALLRYLWSPAAQALVGESYAAPARTDVAAAEPREEQVHEALQGVHIVMPSWEDVARERSTIDQQWAAIARAPQGVSVPIPVPQVP